jgi:hypothetical protein
MDTRKASVAKLPIDSPCARLALGQLAACTATTATLLSQPQLAVLITLAMGLALVASIASALALSYLHLSHDRAAIRTDSLGLIGTYTGGAIVYCVILTHAAKLLPG